MADSRRTREYQPDSPLELQYLNDPSYTPLDRIGGPGMGGAGNESFMTSPAAAGIEGNVDNIQREHDLQRGLLGQLASLQSSPQQSQGLDLGGMWQGIKDAGSAGLGALGSLVPSQDTMNNIGMRLQNMGASYTGQTPLYMKQQQHMMEMGQQQDLMALKRQQMAQQLQDHQFQRQMKMEDHVMGIWKDPHMPLATKKKMSQHFAQQGVPLAANLERLGDEQAVAEMETLAPFLPKGKLEELSQIMRQPNADLAPVEQWLNHAREKKKVIGDAQFKHQRFSELLQQHQQSPLDPMSPEFDEFKEMVLAREKRQKEAQELDLKLQGLGLKNQGDALDNQLKAIMPQYGPEVDLPGGFVQRERLDPQTGQLTTIKGNKPPASVTNVNMKQESAFEQELGKKNVDDIKTTQVKARDSAMIIQNIHQGRQLLDSGMITGVGAEYLTKAGQALQQFGFMKEKDPIKNTQAYASLMAQNVAKHIKEFGAGTGLSDADREYATKMAGGDVTLDEKSIRKILDMNESMSRNLIRLHNKSVKGVKSMIPLQVEEPPEYSPPKKAQASAGGPQVGEVRPGKTGSYRFKGGDPKDKSNWELVK